MRRRTAAWFRRSMAVAVLAGLRLTEWAAWASGSWMPMFAAVVGPGAVPGPRGAAGHVR